MHILIVPSWYPHPNIPTSGIFFKEQAEGLHRAGLKVGIVAPIRRSIRTATMFAAPGGDPMPTAVPTFAEEYFALPRLHAFNDARHLAIGERLFQAYVQQHGKPDLIHAHCALHAGLLARKLSRRHGIPYLLTEHSSSFGRRLLLDAEVRQAEVAVGGARRLVAVSSALEQDLVATLPSTRGRWKIIPNSVDTGFFTPRRRDSGERKATFTFLTVAHLDANKDIANVLTAMSLLSEATADIRLHVGGDGAEADNLKALAARLGVSQRVSFLGNLSRAETRTEIDIADAFVLCSRYETFGVVLIEALAMGRPVIATACGGPNDIVNPTNGMLVPVGNPAALAAAMRKLANDASAYSPDGIRRDCIHVFGADAVASAYGQLYREALAEMAAN
jgi:teichuronic acid biosynthesis glycosyltransferase TuaC